MSNKTELLRDLIIELSDIADDLTRIYPYIEIDDSGLPYGNKRTIKNMIIRLKYKSYTLTQEILDD